ncbi:glycosyltransferase [Streptacidiphilus sp. MAP12-16]|uniref:glycosyltransferase n=1 Tax=Streptacidiphilus sp. MAP12-16 TaxID=3156300 RepID=UPI003512DB93
MPSPTPEPVAAPAAAPAAVAVVIPAHNEASRIALTVLAARQIPGVDLVVVVDDASTDSTARVAEESGATVVRLATRSGRTEALVQGIAQVTAREAATAGLPAERSAERSAGRSAEPGGVRERGPEGGPPGGALAGSAPRHLLFLDADLQQSAAEAVRLLEPVLAGAADLALAAPTADPGPEGVASRRARRDIEQSTGFASTRPLAIEACLTRAALSAAEPLSGGAGAGAGLIIDLLQQGFRVVEVPVAWAHRPPRRGARARLRELRRWREVRRALASR